MKFFIKIETHNNSKQNVWLVKDDEKQSVNNYFGFDGMKDQRTAPTKQKTFYESIGYTEIDSSMYNDLFNLFNNGFVNVYERSLPQYKAILKDSKYCIYTDDVGGACLQLK